MRREGYSGVVVAIVALVAVVGLGLLYSVTRVPGSFESPVGRAITTSSTIQCEDTDSSQDTKAYTSVFTSGTVSTKTRNTDGSWPTSWRLRGSDVCSGSNLQEWYCVVGAGSGYASTAVTCRYGCSSGKCNPPPCDGPSGPDALTAKGALGMMPGDGDFLGAPPARQEGKTYSDICVSAGAVGSPGKVREYWCSEGVVKTGVYSCFSEKPICSGGRCVAPSCSDADGDGYQGSSPAWCTRTTTLDCNDANWGVHPGAIEYCSSSIDYDCDGIIPEGCPSCTDSDRGNVSGVGGSAVTYWSGSGVYTPRLFDACLSSTIINESSCMPYMPSGTIAVFSSYTCENSTTCIDPDGPSGTTPAYCG